MGQVFYTKYKNYIRETRVLTNRFPSWSVIKQDPNSYGHQYFNSIGAIIKRIEELNAEIRDGISPLFILSTLLDAAGTEDEEVYISNIFVLRLDLNELEVQSVKHNGDMLVSARSLWDLINRVEGTDNLDIYWWEQQRGHIYFRKQYDDVEVGYFDSSKYIHAPNTVLKPFVHSTVRYEGSIEKVPILNIVDEWAYKMGIIRNGNESNIDLVHRILDVMKNRSDASSIGVRNGIIRDLGMKHDLGTGRVSVPVEDSLNKVEYDDSNKINLPEISVSLNSFIWSNFNDDNYMFIPIIDYRAIQVVRVSDLTANVFPGEDYYAVKIQKPRYIYNINASNWFVYKNDMWSTNEDGDDVEMVIIGSDAPFDFVVEYDINNLNEAVTKRIPVDYPVNCYCPDFFSIKDLCEFRTLPIHTDEFRDSLVRYEDYKRISDEINSYVFINVGRAVWDYSFWFKEFDDIDLSKGLAYVPHFHDSGFDGGD